MREDAARALSADDDYQFLRSRAEERLRAVDSVRDERASAEDWRAQTRSSPESRRVRPSAGRTRERDAAPIDLNRQSGGQATTSRQAAEAPTRQAAIASSRQATEAPARQAAIALATEEPLAPFDATELAHLDLPVGGRRFTREPAGPSPREPVRRVRPQRAAPAEAHESPEPEPRQRVRRVTPPRSYGTSIGAPPQPYGSPYGGEPGRRTIQITGHVGPRIRQAPTVERFAARPDRTAMWAVLLGFFLVAMAIATAHA